VLRRLFALAGTRLNVDGLENLLPAGQPCIAVSNHASYLDPFVLIAVLPNEFCMVAKAELRESLLPRLVMSRFPVQYIERFDAQKGLADARRVSGVAAEGNSVLFFPEGTITRVAGLLPFHLGAFSAAAENKLPVIPIAISGTRTMLRSGSWFFRPGSINVTIGAPVATESPTTSVDGDQWKLALALRDAAREIILRNCGEADLAHVRLPV
jgi:1-acyl-sn-glycerol-3-phosphate acyltransferase